MFQPSPYPCFDLQADAPVLRLSGRLRAGAPVTSILSEVPYARIESLTQRIAAGTYRIPAVAIAERLMARMLTGDQSRVTAERPSGTAGSQDRPHTPAWR